MRNNIILAPFAARGASYCADCNQQLPGDSPAYVLFRNARPLCLTCSAAAAPPEMLALAKKVNEAGPAPKEPTALAIWHELPDGNVYCGGCGSLTTEALRRTPFEIASFTPSASVVALCDHCSHERAPALNGALHDFYGTRYEPKLPPAPPPPLSEEELAARRVQEARFHIAEILVGDIAPGRALACADRLVASLKVLLSQA